MKILGSATTLTVLLTSPASVAVAQYTDPCRSGCQEQYNEHAAFCDYNWSGWQTEREYCYYYASIDFDSCMNACDSEGASTLLDQTSPRFRPVQIEDEGRVLNG